MTNKLDPANKVIDRFGGQREVMEIAGVDRTRVYRWTLPKTKGGTGGTIPQRHIPALMAAAKERGIDLSAEDFMPEMSQ